MTVKIQINSKDALERLLGDEHTFEVEVRKSVIHAFAQAFLNYAGREVAEVIDEFVDEAKEELLEYAKEQFGISVSNFNLDDRAKRKVIEQVKPAVDFLINEEVVKMSNNIETFVKQAVEQRIDHMVYVYAQRFTEQKFREAFEQAVQKLGIE